ncbi:hypothetical protein P153DRAFT_354207 [Dothidotthia symphoricarpi CBS 119687]|uniref:Uncharacterized protein n=1 Tax=Dothidotthia symphoricarpi CBS 119687 TaxID=1392245 RepID=A0A6A6ANL0_9PLEO|nr:uncharacterized protein P153DRAFT_354207 [Dothidotthia symphoricarpi CBS 119687]KAF2132738.1 hypothetical protein P153DRAFT_354207 [Dothidotthia symphoricarpi CBS 119687]
MDIEMADCDTSSSLASCTFREAGKRKRAEDDLGNRERVYDFGERFDETQVGQDDRSGDGEGIDDAEGIDESDLVHLPIPNHAQQQAENLARFPRVNYSSALGRSYVSLIDAIFSEERVPNITNANNNVQQQLSLCKLFASVPRTILEALLDGSLAHKDLKKHDEEIRQYYHDVPGLLADQQHDWIKQSEAKSAPALYARMLTSEDGEAPSPQDYMALCNILRKYANGDRHSVLLIDSAHSDVAESNVVEPYYLDGKLKHVRQLFTWIRAIELMCEAMPREEWETPHPVPRCYIGYAESILECDAQYMRKQSCAWLVSLVEAALDVVSPYRGYRLRTYAICFFAGKDEVELGERAFTRCTNSYICYGGFNVAPPGQCPSAGLADWHALELWREAHTPFQSNMKHEVGNLEELQHQTDTDHHLFYMQLRCQAINAKQECQRGDMENGALMANLPHTLAGIEGLDLSKLLSTVASRTAPRS